jgi:hypothetical protein
LRIATFFPLANTQIRVILSASEGSPKLILNLNVWIGKRVQITKNTNFINNTDSHFIKNKIMTKLIFITSVLCSILLNVHTIFAQDSKKYFTIRIIDTETGLGVPLVELKTTNNLSYYTDNNGIIAFFEPGLMNQEVYFFIKSHGYIYPKGAIPVVTPGSPAL